MSIPTIDSASAEFISATPVTGSTPGNIVTVTQTVQQTYNTAWINNRLKALQVEMDALNTLLSTLNTMVVSASPEQAAPASPAQPAPPV